MPASLRRYEAILMARPELHEEAIQKLQTQLAESLKRLGGSVVEIVNLGKRRLSYRIKKCEEGIALQIKFQAPPEAISALRKSVSLLEQALRLMVVSGLKSLSKPVV